MSTGHYSTTGFATIDAATVRWLVDEVHELRRQLRNTRGDVCCMSHHVANLRNEMDWYVLPTISKECQDLLNVLIGERMRARQALMFRHGDSASDIYELTMVMHERRQEHLGDGDPFTHRNSPPSRGPPIVPTGAGGGVQRSEKETQTIFIV